MTKKKFLYQKGITLIELVITMMILSILFGFVTVNLLNTRQKTNVNTSLNQLLSDIKLQQAKAMSLSVEGGALTTSDYGIHFESNSYTLFRGSAYLSSSDGNFVVPLGENMEVSNISFPLSSVVFLKRSGEILSFSQGSDSITLKNTTNNQEKTIRMNKYGVFTQID